MLLKVIKNVPIRGNLDILPYKTSVAFFETHEMPEKTLLPAQHYVLEAQLQRVAKIMHTAIQRGYDSFDLREVVNFGNSCLLPPIVEDMVDFNNTLRSTIVDGVHRVAVAIQQQRPITVLRLINVDRRYPYYAYPNKEGWSQVQRLSEGFPKDFVKRQRRLSKDVWYRDFNHVFPGVKVKR
jgi:hypothetical protein